MPIIINGGSYRAGGWWAKHLQNGEKNERVQVVEFTGITAETVPGAFREMEGIAAGTKCQNYFYQANINPREDERLTSAQWREAIDTLEQNLGLTGQPRFVIEHEKKGRVHRHVIWSRIDADRMVAISDSLTAPIHERTSRTLEIKFDLERGVSILTPNREFERPERRPQKNETFRTLDSGIDPQTVKAELRSLWERADNGQSFKAALENESYVLARGDRRDFVVIDRAGDDHSLARRLGIKAADVRERMADIDRAALPSVAEAKVQQRAQQADRGQSQAHVELEPHSGTRHRYDRLRETEREVAREQFKSRYDELRAAEPPPEIAREFASNANRTAEPPTPVYDRDAENQVWETKVSDAAIGKAPQAGHRSETDADRDTRAGVGEGPNGSHSRGKPEDTRPLGQTAGDIRTAWVLAHTANELEDALAARGITLAQVSAEDARRSEINAALIKEVGNIAHVLKEGDIVAVNSHGNVYRLDRRTTGHDSAEIAGKLAGLDRATLLDVTDAREVMREASRAAWRDDRRTEREQARPPTAIETTIADALANTMTGIDFAITLDEKGITIARATETDVKALDALRDDANLAAVVAQADDEPINSQHFATLQAGDFAAVSRAGDVFRLNPHKLDFETIEQRLADTQTRMPGVVEARASYEIAGERRADDREKDAAFWDGLRAANSEARTARADAAERRETIHESMHDTSSVISDALDAEAKGSARVSGGLASMVERLLSGVFNFFFPPAPPTPHEAAEAASQARDNQAAREEKAERIDQIVDQGRQQQHERENFIARYGAPPAREVDKERGRDNDHEPERD